MTTNPKKTAGELLRAAIEAALSLADGQDNTLVGALLNQALEAACSADGSRSPAETGH